MKNCLEKLRKENGITQKELAEKFDITSDYVSMLERGTRSPGLKLAKAISLFFKVKIEDIFFDI